ncbi:MAG: hypothetical protein ACKVJ5_11440, partial [Pseudoalteromonas sp.]
MIILTIIGISRVSLINNN